MKGVFYTISALVLLVVVSLLINVQHDWVRSQEDAALYLTRGEKILRTYDNVMNQFIKCLAASFSEQRTPSSVSLDASFNASLNNTDPDEQHFFHLLNNVQKLKEFVTLYGENELNLDNAELDTVALEEYLVNSSHSLLFSVEPYDIDYEWSFTSGLRDEELVISKAGSAGDSVGVHVTGPGQNYDSASCCSSQNLTFGVKGNVSVYWAPEIVLDFSELDPSQSGMMTVDTHLELPYTNERIKVKVRGAVLNLTSGHTRLEEGSILIG